MPGNKVKVTQLFEKRERQFKQSTAAIKQLLQPMLESCRKYIASKHSEEFAKRVNWQGVTRTGEQNELILVYATIDYVEGETYTDDEGNYIEQLTKEDALALTQPMQVVLPIEFVDATEEEIVAHFAEREEAAKEYMDAWQKALVHQVSDHMVVIDEDDNEYELTEEQQEYIRSVMNTDNKGPIIH